MSDMLLVLAGAVWAFTITAAWYELTAEATPQIPAQVRVSPDLDCWRRTGPEGSVVGCRCARP